MVNGGSARYSPLALVTEAVLWTWKMLGDF